MSIHESFNQSGFAKFINSPAGRIFRIAAGIGFIVVGYVFRDYTLGLVSMVWGVVPLVAGIFDLCFISAILGGPISGKKIRSKQK
jgi:hypothetical protein